MPFERAMLNAHSNLSYFFYFLNPVRLLRELDQEDEDESYEEDDEDIELGDRVVHGDDIDCSIAEAHDPSMSPTRGASAA